MPYNRAMSGLPVGKIWLNLEFNPVEKSTKISAANKENGH